PDNTVLFVCDIQERFRSSIYGFPGVILTTNNMGSSPRLTRGSPPLLGRQIKGARLLDIPVVVTEQNPKGKKKEETPAGTAAVFSALGAGLGRTVHELDISDAKLVVPKTKFSMVVPEVKAKLADWNTRSVILCGIATSWTKTSTSTFSLTGARAGRRDRRDARAMAGANGRFPGTDVRPRSIQGLVDEPLRERHRPPGAVVTTFESVLFQLIVDSGHEKFKAVSALVK
ncbi:MAG: isochorismatase domain-containing protein 1-like protein, partial [Olpidium bornovanus]